MARIKHSKRMPRPKTFLPVNISEKQTQSVIAVFKKHIPENSYLDFYTVFLSVVQISNKHNIQCVMSFFRYWKRQVLMQRFNILQDLQAFSSEIQVVEYLSNYEWITS